MIYNKITTLSIFILFLSFNSCDTATEDDEPPVLKVTVQPGYFTESSSAYKLWIIVCKENGDLVDYVKFTEEGKYGLKIPKENYDLHVAYVNNPSIGTSYRNERVIINTYRSVSTRELFFRGRSMNSIALQDVVVSDIPSGSRAQVSTSNYSSSIGNGSQNPIFYSFRVPVFAEQTNFLITVTPTNNPDQPRFSWISRSPYYETLNINYQNLQPMSTHTLDGAVVSGNYTLRGYIAEEDQPYTVSFNNPLLENEIHYPKDIFDRFQFSLTIVKDSYRYSNSFSGSNVFSQPIIDPAFDLNVINASTEDFSCTTSGEYTYAYQTFSFTEFGSGFSNSINWYVASPSNKSISYKLPTLPADVTDELPLLTEKQLSLSTAGLVFILEISNYTEYTRGIYSEKPRLYIKSYSKYKIF